jgi:leader peptidase (prepilin peptidase)/N-methyltransferase
MIIILVLLFALITGSFLNVVICRLPVGESVVWPGSRCTACGHGLGAKDLVPVLSWLWLKGRCRYCDQKISLRYPGIELLTGLAFLLIYFEWDMSYFTVSGCLLTSILITGAAIDYDKGIIPNIITYLGIVLGLLLSYFTVGVPSAFLGALLFGGILFLAGILSRGGMGGGDIKLALLIGAFTGLQGSALAFILTSLIGGVWAVYLLASRKAGRKTVVKFGPCLAIGGWLAFVYGTEIINAYFTMLNNF